MRIRRIAAPAVVGALGLAAAAVPGTAFAAGTPKPVVTSASVTSLNIGLTGKLTLQVRFSARDAKGVKNIKVMPYPIAYAKDVTQTEVDTSNAPVTVLRRTATTLTVGHSETVDAATFGLPNQFAGTWGVAILVTAKDNSKTFELQGTTFSWKRADVLAAKASASSLHKGATVTFKGRLDRADWDKRVWAGNGGQSVQLQFRNSGGAWVTKAVAKTAANGAVSVSARDYSTGSWRVVYNGNVISGAAVSGSSYVVVK